MEFRFTPDEESFRQEIREFLQGELRSDVAGMFVEEYSGDDLKFTQSMIRKLAARRWLALGWPPEYGGLGASETEQLIYREEVSYYRVPGADVGIGGITWVGPMLLLFGTEEQKKRFLPPTAAGDCFWCTGFSEPDTGSDLAGLKCQARKQDNQYVLNGSKTWTSAAHVADYCFLAARTDAEAPKHQGISLFIVNMRSPGITIRPIASLTGIHSHNEVYFDDARVPENNLIGKENGGWALITTALTFERHNGIVSVAYARRLIDDIVEYVRIHHHAGYIQADYRCLRSALADAAIEAEVARLLAYRAVLAGGNDPFLGVHLAATAKVLSSELFQRVTHLAVNSLGLYGQLRKNSKWAQLDGEPGREYLLALGATLAGGTSEIQRSLIATVGLGLPRSA